MPYFRKKRAFFKRRRRSYKPRKFSYRKKRRGNASRAGRRRSTAIIRAPSAMPDRLTTRHTAVYTLSRSTDGTTFTWTGAIKANSLEQPFPPQVQVPNGYKELGAIYQRYMVYGASLKLTTRVTGAVPGVFIVCPSFQPSIPAGIDRDELMAQPKAWTTRMDEYNQHTSKRYFRTRNILARDMMQTPNLNADYGSDPALMWFFLWRMDFTYAPPTNYKIEVEFHLNQYTTWYKTNMLEQDEPPAEIAV